LNALGILDPVEPLKTDEAKVRFFVLGQQAWGINNVLGLCNFCSIPIHAMTFPRLVETVTAVTGWETSLHEILKASERSLVMARIFNNREGFEPKDDRVIRRWHEKMPGGPLEGHYIEPDAFRKAIDLFYEVSVSCTSRAAPPSLPSFNGWDKGGRPKRGKLIELNLEWLIDQIALAE